MKPLFHIKICGITTPADALAICEAGVSAVGINFYPDSSRFVGTNLAVQICNAIDRFNSDRSDLRNVLKVGLFVNSSAAEIASRAMSCGLNAVQFHGNEKTSELTGLRNLLEDRHPGCIFIRAIGINSNAPSRLTEVARVQAEIDAWTSAGVDAILFDTAIAGGQFGGTGQAMDWSFVPEFHSDVPVILAGGLNSKNVAQAISASGVNSVDVASGVELEPGVKDLALVVQFVAEAKGAMKL